MTALRRARAAESRGAGRPDAPYRGLAAYEAGDAKLFFGRQRLTDDILERIAALARDPGPTHGVLVVIGPSGAGKSSVLRAGVGAAVAAGRLDRADATWSVTLGTPLAMSAEATTGTRHLLVVDQFEEIFTALDADRRTEVVRAVTTPQPGRVVVLGMRADFYSDAARVPALHASLQHEQVLIAAMNADELRAAIRLPAEQAGVPVDDGLVDLLLAELDPALRESGAHDAGTLPLLSHALLVAWEHSSGTQLTVADYRATGGIDGAVQQTAEAAFGELSPAQQQLARVVFLRLVTVDGEVVTTRRRMAADEVRSLGVGELGSWTSGTGMFAADASRLVARFVERRLVTAGDGWFEISHEALLSAWPRLRDWIDEDRAGLVTHRQLIDATRAWVRADRDPAALLRGSQLELAAQWAREHRAALNEVELDFVAQSSRRHESDLRAERHRLLRLRGLVAASAVLVLVAVVLTLVFVQARDRAEHAQSLERSVRNAAESRAIAFEAAQLRTANPALAQQLALAAYRAGHTQQARAELVDESAQPVITRILGQSGPTSLAVSSTRGIVAVSHAVDGTVHLYTLRGGAVPRPLAVIPGTVGKQIFAMAFNHAGTLLAVGGESKVVRLWNLTDVTHPALVSIIRPTGFGGAIEAMAISPDGQTLVAGSDGPEPVMRWSIVDPRHPAALPPLPGIAGPRTSTITTKALAFDSSGRTLAAADTDGHVRLWTMGTTHVPAPRLLPTGSTGVFALAFDPVAPLLFTAGASGVVDVWSANGSTAKPLHVLGGRTDSQINTLAVSPDGRTLAAGSSDNDLRQWDVPLFAVRSDTSNPGPVTGAAFLPDGRIAYTAADGTLRLQQLGGPQLPASGPVFALSWSSDGQRLLVASSGPRGGEQLWDAVSPTDSTRLGPLLTMPKPWDPVAGTGAMTPDGELVAGGNAQGRVELWDTSDPQHPHATTAPFAADTDDALVESLAFSPDGHLLAVGGDDGEVHLWDVADPARPHELATMKEGNLVLNVTISPSGRYLAAANADDSAYLYDISDPARPARLARITGTHNYVWGVAFSPNGRMLATADADETTRLFDISEPSRPHQIGRALIGPSDYVYSADFSPNGRTLAVASNDGTVRTYRADGRDRVPTETLRGGGDNLFAAAYSPNGRTLAGGGRADRVTLWSTDAERYAAELCAAAGTPVTRAEWALYVPDEPYDPPCR